MRNTFQHHSLKAVVCHNHFPAWWNGAARASSFSVFNRWSKLSLATGNRLIRLLGVEVSYYDIGPQAYPPCRVPHV